MLHQWRYCLATAQGCVSCLRLWIGSASIVYLDVSGLADGQGYMVANMDRCHREAADKSFPHSPNMGSQMTLTIVLQRAPKRVLMKPLKFSHARCLGNHNFARVRVLHFHMTILLDGALIIQSWPILVTG
jgi:hypothetical protein